MNKEEFQALAAQGYNHSPIMREVLADLETPLSTYLKLAHGPYSYLFESVQGGEKWGRYSIIGLPSRTRLVVRGRKVSVYTDGQVVEEEETADPLDWIARFKERYRAPDLPGLPRFAGGLVGWLRCCPCLGLDGPRVLHGEGARGRSEPRGPAATASRGRPRVSRGRRCRRRWRPRPRPPA